MGSWKKLTRQKIDAPIHRAFPANKTFPTISKMNTYRAYYEQNRAAMEQFNEQTGREFVCSLCAKQSKGYGNNPQPLKEFEERCCDECNYTMVIPARIAAADIDRHARLAMALRERINQQRNARRGRR